MKPNPIQTLVKNAEANFNQSPEWADLAENIANNAGFDINQNSEWAKMSRWQKRKNGFFTYCFAAIVSILNPEKADRAMYHCLKEQFIDKK